MNLQEDIQRIKEVMGINEQTTPIKNIGPSYLETLITKYLLPIAMPAIAPATGLYNYYMEKGRKIYNDFANIVNRRIDYNKKNNLPLDKFTPEELSYRTKLKNATPTFGYPNPFEFLGIISDIESGKNVESDYEGGKNDSGYRDKLNHNDNDAFLNRSKQRQDLKSLWFGTEDINHLSNGTYIKSEFKPSGDTGKNQYIRPKTLPVLSKEVFDILYNTILKTRLPNGKFPGGNSKTVYEYLKADDKQFKICADSLMKIGNQLGNYKLGASEENGKKFISVFDIWDLEPPVLMKMGINIQQFANKPKIYFRLY
jgi:hypothetical protein